MVLMWSKKQTLKGHLTQAKVTYPSTFKGYSQPSLEKSYTDYGYSIVQTWCWYGSKRGHLPWIFPLEQIESRSRTYSAPSTHPGGSIALAQTTNNTPWGLSFRPNCFSLGSFISLCSEGDDKELGKSQIILFEQMLVLRILLSLSSDYNLALTIDIVTIS